MWNALHTQYVPQETYTLTLQSNKPSIEPSGTTAGDGNSSATLTVTVIDQSTQQGPTKPVQVKLVAHKPTDGGHDHDDPSRPRCRLNGTECTTDDPCVTPSFNGGVATQTVNYNAPIVSGKHSFSATCDKCGNSPQRTNLEVKVEGLEQIPDSQFYQLYERVGNTYKAVGETAEHHSNHFLTPAASEVLWRIASAYRFEPRFMKAGVLPLPLHVNDASLKDGGKFDINGTWTGSHKEHTRGVSVDIRANTALGAIARVNFDTFNELLFGVLGDAVDNGGVDTFLRECTKDKPSTPENPQPQHKRTWAKGCVSQLDGSQDIGRHYHLRLMGVAK